MKIRSLWLSLLAALAGCASISRAAPVISILDLPGQNIIRVTNGSNNPARLYYGYYPEFGDLQMFLVRFRGADGVVFPVSGSREGWFTPKVHSGTLGIAPSRALEVPANGSLNFRRDVDYFAGFTLWDGPAPVRPCQVQIKFLAYLDRARQIPVEATSEWQPGPCPS